MTEKQVVEQFNNNKTKQNCLNEETTQQYLANIRQRLAKTSDSKSVTKDVETGTIAKSQQQGRKKENLV